MFKKFNVAEDIAGRQNVKSSVQRGIRTKIIESFPKLEPHLEDIIPKKSQLSLVKWYALCCEGGQVLMVVESIFRY